MRRVRIGLALSCCILLILLPGTVFSQTPEATPTVDSPIAYQSSGAVYVLEPGVGSRPVAPSVNGSHEAPDWSPDGTKIVFHIDWHEIAYADVATGEVTSIVTCNAPCGFVFDPAWSPDGSSIAYVRIIAAGATTGAAQIVVVDIDTRAEQVAYEDTAGDIWLYQPRWAPDGQRLVVDREQFASTLLSEERILGTSLGIIDIETAKMNQLAATEGGVAHDWSPKGDLIVFDRDGNLATVRPDGSDLTSLTKFDPKVESAIQPTFAPDGSSIVFVWVHGVIGQGETPNIGVLPLDGSDPYQIADTDWFTHPRLRP